MKGISTVVATILMLMITIAMAGVAYMYISGAIMGVSAKAIKLVDVTCDPDTGDVTYTVKNLDPKTDIAVGELTFFWNGTLQGTNGNPISRNGVASFTFSGIATTPGPNSAKVVGPSNSDEKPDVYC